MVRLIGNQNDLLFVKVIKGHTIFLCHPHIHMESLCSGKADVDGILVGILEIVHLVDADAFPVQHNLICKRYFEDTGLQKFSRVFSTMFERLTKNKKFRYPCL